ncbi:uncharacterized protein LOC144166065 [Haemaphysalis longicornis]
MPAADNPLCLFVQLAAILGTCPAACADRLRLAPEIDACPLFDSSPCVDHGWPPCAALEPYYAEASVTSSSRLTDHITGWRNPSPFSGHWIAAVMPAADNPLCLFVQLAAILGTCPAACADRLRLAPEIDACPLFDSSPCVDHGWPPCATLEPYYAEASVTSSSRLTDHITGWRNPSPFSGHWIAAVMPAADNPLCLFVQVGPAPPLFSKRSNNLFLLLFPCPSVLACTVVECVFVTKMLLVSGDVELNPGPTKQDASKQNSDVLLAIQDLTKHLDQRHDTLIKSIDEVKENQKLLESKVLDLTTRLTDLEKRVDSFEDFQDGSHVQEMVATAVRSEHASFQARLDEFEDRSRRENLIFYGIEDSASETWADSEEKVRSILTSTLNLQLPDEAIARANREFNGTTEVDGREPPSLVSIVSSETLKVRAECTGVEELDLAVWAEAFGTAKPGPAGPRLAVQQACEAVKRQDFDAPKRAKRSSGDAPKRAT